MRSREIAKIAVVWTVAVVGVWGIYRLLPGGTLIADVNYYYAWLTFEGGPHFSSALVEYPLPAAVLLSLPLLFVEDVSGYVAMYVLAIIVLIGLWFIMLAAGRDDRPPPVPLLDPVIAWGALILAIGPLVVFRFDIIPALFVGLALIVVSISPALFAHCVAWGTAMKLWPVVLIPLVLGNRHRWRAVGVFVASGIAFVAFSAAVGGIERVFSPLAWQGKRGLHTESVAASWITLARLGQPESWRAELSDNNSVDYFGPGVDLTAHVTSLATVLAIVWLVTVTARMVKYSVCDPVTIATVTVALIGLLIATNKVFSPQYVVWLLPAWTALLALNRRTRGKHLPTGWLYGQTLLLIALTFLTQLVYPTLYRYLFWEPTALGFGIASLLLVARNVILVAWVSAAAFAAWKRTGKP